MFDLAKIVRPNIQNLIPYSSARDEFSGSDQIFLDANENPFGTQNRYPDPRQTALKNKISLLKNIEPHNIFIGNGSDEIIDLCFRIFCEPGQDKVLTFSPTYGMYEVSAAINNVVLEKIALDENFQIDYNSLSVLNDKNLKLIFICSPNNPTGNSIAAVEYVLQNFNGIVVVDEAYIDFSDYNSISDSIHKYPNLIVLQTLSKAWGLAAIRIGMAFTNEKIISYLNKVKPPYNISSPNQKAALNALRDADKIIEQRTLIVAERTRMVNALQKIECVNHIYPSQTNFLLIRVSDADAVYDHLLLHKIVIRNRNKIIVNCLRITVGTKKENDGLIAALKIYKS